MNRASTWLPAALSAAGIDAVYGLPLDGFAVTEASVTTATLLCTAHEYVHHRAAFVHEGNGVLRRGESPPAAKFTITEIEQFEEIAAFFADHPGESFELQLDVDPASPAPKGWAAPVSAAPLDWLTPDDDTLTRLAAAENPVVLAGPGVVSDGAIAGLHALATAGSLGVANTWGAKGVYDWRSRHHWATVGLQADDFDLVGFAEADLLVATGVDEREAPPARWTDRVRSTVTVAPRALDALAEAWSRDRRELTYPPLRSRLGAVSQAGWEATTLPMPPTRATLTYAAVFGARGVVTADAGTVGFWVARTYTTVRPKSVFVPASVVPDFAIASALVCRLQEPRRAALAVSGSPLGARARELMEIADRVGVPVAVELWNPDGEVLTAEHHAARLRELSLAEHSTVVSLRTDDRQLAQMVDAGGPIVAWDDS